MLNTDQFKRGTVELVVLHVLTQKDMYGYEITKAVSQCSGGDFEIPLGTLYPVLYRLIENGCLSDKDEIVNRRLRKYYHLEDAGRAYYGLLLAEDQKTARGVDRIIGGGEAS